MKRFGLGRFAAVLLGLALVASACSSDDEDATETETESSTETTEAMEDGTDSTTAEEPADGAVAGDGTLSGLTVVDDLTFTVELETPRCRVPAAAELQRLLPDAVGGVR